MLKKTILTLIFLYAILVSIYPQYSFLGYKGGYNFSSFKEGLDISAEDTPTGTALGLSVTNMFDKKYAVTIECLYTMMGGYISTDQNGTENEELVLNLPYIMVPVIFKYYLADRVFFTYIGGGVYMSYLPGVSCCIGKDNPPMAITDYKDIFNRNETGFILTGGIDMIFDAGGIITAEARIYLGNEKIIRNDDTDLFSSYNLSNLENYSLSFYLGYANGISFENLLDIILSALDADI